MREVKLADNKTGWSVPHDGFLNSSGAADGSDDRKHVKVSKLSNELNSHTGHLSSTFSNEQMVEETLEHNLSPHLITAGAV